MQLIDSHAHLETYDDLKGVLKRAQDAGVSKIVTIGTSLESSKKAIEIAQKYSSADLQIWATCGLHPKDAKREIVRLGVNESIHRLKLLAKSSNKVIGIGEAGLDYYLTTENGQLTTDEGKEFQRKLFSEQVELAEELNLPLVIHCRNGWEEIFELISNIQTPNSKLTGVFHSWTGDWKAAKKALDLGFYISFSGIVTFKSAKEIQEVARKAPIDKILVETDSPFLSPEPLRSTLLHPPLKLQMARKLRGSSRNPNEPKNVRIIAEFLANIRNQSANAIFFQTTKNAQKLFNLL